MCLYAFPLNNNRNEAAGAQFGATLSPVCLTIALCVSQGQGDCCGELDHGRRLPAGSLCACLYVCDDMCAYM
eukprot:1003455-Rhodomonas_salina.1